MPLILGIETSCDETSAAVVRDGGSVLSCVIASSKQEFATLGGVVPEYAARKQLEAVLPVIDEAMERAGITPDHLDAIAVTRGPGLLGSLLVGTTTARALSYAWNVPLIGIHHNLGHLDSVWLREGGSKDGEDGEDERDGEDGEDGEDERDGEDGEDGEDERDGEEERSDVPCFPCLTLSVSGGHTELWHRTSHLTGTLLGETQDDAAGEAFDKGALLLGLPYPGGPALSKLAQDGDEHAYAFPLPLQGDGSCNFSFSGLKTSLKYLLRDTDASSEAVRSDIAASYQRAICLHLVDRIRHALASGIPVREIHIVGGVSANTRLRAMLTESFPEIRVRWPSAMAYCTDNAAMIAAAADNMLRERPALAREPFVTLARTPSPVGPD